MKKHLICALALAVLVAPAAQAQEMPKPGPEHEMLKKMEGNWDTTMKAAGAEFKGHATYKMELGGLWLVSNFESDLGGMKFQGKGLDGYDTHKKKYVAVFCHSMETAPIIMEGTYDKAKKTLTMHGESPGPDGKPMKHKSTTVMPDDNTIEFSMFMGAEKEPGFTITYKRKK